MGKRPDGYWKSQYRTHREQRLAESKAYAAAHKEQRRVYNARYYAANRERIAEQAKDYRRRNAAERKKRRKAEYAADPERFKRQSREWQAANPEKRFEQRLRKYGITAVQYRQILARQGGGCAVCGLTDSGDRRGGRLHVDHDHDSGQVRGILCTNCNLGIGKFGDDPGRLRRAAIYLRYGKSKAARG